MNVCAWMMHKKTSKLPRCPHFGGQWAKTFSPAAGITSRATTNGNLISVNDGGHEFNFGGTGIHVVPKAGNGGSTTGMLSC